MPAVTTIMNIYLSSFW